MSCYSPNDAVLSDLMFTKSSDFSTNPIQNNNAALTSDNNLRWLKIVTWSREYARDMGATNFLKIIRHDTAMIQDKNKLV